MPSSLLVVVFSVLCHSLFAQEPARKAISHNVLHQVSYAGFRGQVFDAGTGKILSARLVVTDDTGHVYSSYYSKLPGFFTEQDGSFELPLSPGNYLVEIFHGIDYLSQKFTLKIESGKGVEARIFLEQWYPLKQQQWLSGDGHDHLYTDLKPDTAMASLVRKICLAQGIDFVCTAQGWLGYNDSTWRTGFAQFSDDRFTLSYGSEMPKYRTGHTWWFGQRTTRNYFWQAMDSIYEHKYYQSDSGVSWNFNDYPFPNIPDAELVQRFKQADHSIAIAAHPTSWWMQKRGNIEKYVTNAAVNLAFGLLSGKIWDGTVVMGYDHDHYYYQNLWFHVLNEGYKMAAFSELDGGLGKDDKFYYGSMRTYFKMGNIFSAEKLTEAARKGRTFVTSGPILMADIDSRYEMSDEVPADGKPHQLHIKAYASGEQDDYLSYIVVFRNGRIFKLWDIRDQHLRKYEVSLPLTEKERSWYAVKIYGKRAWKNHSSLDVMRVCEKLPGDSVEYSTEEMDVAISSPFYFRSKSDKNPGVLQSDIELKIPAQKEGDDITIDVLLAGKKINSVSVKNGKAHFKMPVNAILKITAPGQKPVYRGLYLDYIPHRDLLEDLASGRWKNRYDSGKFQPGEIPWECFNFSKTKELLSKVNWEIDLSPNERDSLWEKFGMLFRKEK